MPAGKPDTAAQSLDRIILANFRLYPKPVEVTAIAYGPNPFGTGRLVTIGDAGAAYSDDGGFTWQTSAFSTSFLTRAAYGRPARLNIPQASMFIFQTGIGTNPSQLIYTLSGTNQLPFTPPGTITQFLVFPGRDNWVLMGIDATTFYVYEYDDIGGAGTLVFSTALGNVPGFTGASALYNPVTDSNYIIGVGWTIVNSNASIWTLEINDINYPTTTNLNNVANLPAVNTDNGTMVIRMRRGPPVATSVFKSVNGLNFEAVPMPERFISNGGVDIQFGFNNEIFVGMSSNFGEIYMSDDNAESFQLLNSPPGVQSAGQYHLLFIKQLEDASVSSPIYSHWVASFDERIYISDSIGDLS